MGELDLRRRAAPRERLLDLVERGNAGHAAEAEPDDLVVGRALLRKARHAARDRDHEPVRGARAPAGGGADECDQPRLGPLDARGQRRIAEQRSHSVHPPS
jgi:hypothetical protein